MKTDFDFEKIGKQMPYSVPQGFFDSMPAAALAEAKKREERKKKQRTRLWIGIASATAAAACLVLVLQPGSAAKDRQPAIAVAVHTAQDSIKTIITIDIDAIKPVDKRNSLPKTLVVSKSVKKNREAVQEIPIVEQAPITLDSLLAQMSDDELFALEASMEDDFFVEQ